MKSENIINVSDAARISGFSKQWIWTLCKTGKIKAVRVQHGWHSRWEIQLDSLLEYVREMKRLGTEKHSPV